MSNVVASQNLDNAFQAVYKNRKHYHHNNDIWHLSSKWTTHKKQIQTKFLNGSYNRDSVNVKQINGEYKIITQEISTGCIFSPLMGAIVLRSLDNKISEKNNVSYIRDRDDWVMWTQTKVVLRKYIKLMHTTLKELKFKFALDKTYIGKISQGFDFLGYRFNILGLICLAKKTMENFINKATMLYELDASDHRICCYFNNWRKWTRVVL